MKIAFNNFDEIPYSLQIAFVQRDELEFDNDKYVILDKECLEQNEYIRSLLDQVYNEGFEKGYDDGYEDGYTDGYEF